MRRVSVCSSLGESALEAELIDIKSQIQHIEEQFEKYPPHKRSRDEIRGRRRRHGSRGKGETPVGKVDESTSTGWLPWFLWCGLHEQLNGWLKWLAIADVN